MSYDNTDVFQEPYLQESLTIHDAATYDFSILLDFICQLRTACQRLMRAKIAPFNLNRLIASMCQVEEVLEKMPGEDSIEDCGKDEASSPKRIKTDGELEK